MPAQRFIKNRHPLVCELHLNDENESFLLSFLLVIAQSESQTVISPGTAELKSSIGPLHAKLPHSKFL